MSILTGVVIVVTMATLAQRSDSVIDFLTADSPAAIQPQSDEAVAVAGRPLMIDVLGNDSGLTEEDRRNVSIVVAPSCGAAEATEAGVLYLSNDSCVGSQLFAYCVRRGSECQSTPVTVRVADAKTGAFGNAPAEPAAGDIVAQAPSAAATGANQAPQPALPAPTAGEAPRGDDSRVAQAPRLAIKPMPTSAGSRDSAPQAEQTGVSSAAFQPTAAAPVAAPQIRPARIVSDGGAAPLVMATPGAARAPDLPGGRDSQPEIGDDTSAAARIDAPQWTPSAAPDVRHIAALGGPDPIIDGEIEAAAIEPIAGQDTRSAAQAEEALRALTENLVRTSRPAQEPTGAADASDLLSREALEQAAREAIARSKGAASETTTAGTAATQPLTTAALDPAATGPTPGASAGELEFAKADSANLPSPGEAEEPAPAPRAAAAPGCAPDRIAARPEQGGETRIVIDSKCHAGQTFAVLHAGLAFGGSIGADGRGEISLPVLDISGGDRVRFADGAEAPVTLAYNERELNLIHRIAVAWTAPVDLDLHAFEYAAPFGGEGHVWARNPRGFRDVRRPGGGFHLSYPAAAEGGQSIEVYTFWASRRARAGHMRIALDHASRGETPAGAYCGDGALAAPGYTVVRSQLGAVVETLNGRFAPAACGRTLSADARYASGALPDLRIAR